MEIFQDSDGGVGFGMLPVEKTISLQEGTSPSLVRVEGEEGPHLEAYFSVEGDDQKIARLLTPLNTQDESVRQMIEVVCEIDLSAGGKINGRAIFDALTEGRFVALLDSDGNDPQVVEIIERA